MRRRPRPRPPLTLAGDRLVTARIRRTSPSRRRSSERRDPRGTAPRLHQASRTWRCSSRNLPTRRADVVPSNTASSITSVGSAFGARQAFTALSVADPHAIRSCRSETMESSGSREEVSGVGQADHDRVAGGEVGVVRSRVEALQGARLGACTSPRSFGVNAAPAELGAFLLQGRCLAASRAA